MSIPASEALPGDRGFSNLMKLALEFYLRHKVNVDIGLSPELVAALDALVPFLAEIIANNILGPE